MQLVIGHCVVCALEPVNVFGFREWCSGRTGNPQAFARIAALCFALIAPSVRALPSAFFEPYHRAVPLWQKHGKRQVGVGCAVRTMLCRQTEIPVKGVLRVKVDAAMLEKRIKFFLRTLVLRIELVDIVVLDIERLYIPFGLYDTCFTFCDRMVQQPVTHKVHKSVGETPARCSAKKCGCSLIKEMMLYTFCCCGLKQHLPCWVTMNLSLRMRRPSLSSRTYEG